ncbi:beta-1,3-galactosyl-O-glycosyl-glycoprotein beta-1,6-N-acetylglucosaminyltransferase-like isoform X1 [Haliotis rufescens]|uniref:beta-1,3-galactosyl-O-glycosyl-glycoprotein beta-1,6-N-acetylglucosaminyltransferase-like isoform X1 n=2 Tax=Haliotis rufescens TaxID=6454 RepID=UPI00201F76E9|nr:beta-1,3-galactosyl-O-glycosyl-glycoprotein beta-1,6-N-acetylglucosaminyltransferase-like isoform X1 [Haliotis rufescens]
MKMETVQRSQMGPGGIFRRLLLASLTSSFCVFLIYGLSVWDILPPPRLVTVMSPGRVNCSRLFKGDKEEIARAKLVTRSNETEQQYSLLGTNCNDFLSKRLYIQEVSKAEAEFPIAFTVLMYKDFEQFERLLRAIYRPHNVYCIHVDAKSSSGVRDSVTSLATCLPNVFLSSRSVAVRWGKFTVLEPELVCMQDLLKHKWRYLINLTGQEFPLKTNMELVQILKAYDGANDIEGTVKRVPDRKSRWGNAGRPPHNIRAVKGAVHIVANRQYVEYIVHDPVANDLLTWLKRTTIPDETFFATLNHNPHLKIPGTYQGEPETDLVKKPFLARYKVWEGGKIFGGECRGKYVRKICIFGVGDLAKFPERKELFANKFHLHYQPAALQCMDEWYFSRAQRELDGESTFDDSYYKTLGFVKHKIPNT